MPNGRSQALPKAAVDTRSTETTTNKNGERTRVLLLDAAETLFSEHGLEGVSLRDIVDSARVTLALVNYHFGSKEKLYRAVFERRIAPLSASRRAALALVMERKSPAPHIREVLDALARPWVEMRHRPGGLAYSRLVAREASDPSEGKRGIVTEMLDPIAREFMAAMQQVLPGMDKKGVAWGYHFFIGALLAILANPARVTRLSGDSCDMDDEQAIIKEVVQFFSAALVPGRPFAKSAAKNLAKKSSKTPSKPRPSKPSTPSIRKK